MKRFLSYLIIAYLFCAPVSAQGWLPLSNAPSNIVSVPVGFNWTPPFNIFLNNGTYSTNFNINSFIPPIAKTYYVSVTGNDGNPGTLASPFGTFGHAATRSDVDAIVFLQTGVQAANGAWIYWGGRGWNNTVPTRSISVTVNGGGRIASVAAASTAAPTWTKTAGLTNTYQTPASGAGRKNGTIDLKYIDGNGDFDITSLAASCAAVDLTPNTYFYDGSTTICVQAQDSRSLIGDPYMTAGYQGINGTFSTAAAITLWASNIDFVGGGSPFSSTQPSAPVGATPALYLLNCSFQGSNITSDGFFLSGQYTGAMQNCRAANNWFDGFGYHASNSVFPQFFEYACTTGFNGIGNSGSDQASSAHDSANIITLNPNYAGSANQTINDILSSQRWMLGGIIRAPAETDLNGNTLQIGVSVQHWIDGTTISPAATFTLGLNGTGSVMNYRNTPLNLLTKTGPGTLQTY